MPSSNPIGSSNSHVLRRAQPDQLEHEAALVLQLRGAREHRADLIDEQDGEQHQRDAEEVDGHFPEQVALQNSQSALILRRLRLHFRGRHKPPPLCRSARRYVIRIFCGQTRINHDAIRSFQSPGRRSAQ